MTNNYKNRFVRSLFLWTFAVLLLLGFLQPAHATTCPNATVINPAALPTNATIVCGSTDDITATNVVSVGTVSTLYFGGWEALYSFTPTTTALYDISIAGQTYTSIVVYNGCPTTAGSSFVGGIANASASKNLVVTLTAGVNYFILFDTWPTPQSPCPGTFTVAQLVSNTATATATGGLWSSPATWVGGVLPNAASTVVIPAGSIVTVDQLTTISELNIDGILQWNATANAMSLFGNLSVNPTGRLLPYTTAAGGATGITLNIGGNFTNNGYANLAMGTTTSTLVNFNGSGSTLSGTGTFEGDGTRGIIRALFFQNNGSNSISTTQPLTTYSFGFTGGSLNTNGLLRIDNTAQIFGRPFNTQVASVQMTSMGSLYNAAPVVFGAGVTQWTNITGALNTLYVSGNNVYRCTVAANIGPSAPTHTSGIAQNLLWIGTVGTLGNPFLGGQAHVAGTQYFYGGNLYTCITAGIASATAPPTHTSGVAFSNAAGFLYVGTPAQVSVNYDAATQTVRSLNLVNAGSGYSSSTAPTLVFSLGVAGGAGSGAAATAMVPYAIFGPANSTTQKSGIATITGGLTINSDGGASALSSDPQSSAGVNAVYLTNGGVNYTVAPLVGFSGPTALNLVTNPGSGYTSAPTITVTGGTLVAGTALGSSNFTITVNQGKVVSVYLTGTTAQYSVPPTLAFSGGGGTGATLAFPSNCWPAATAVIGSNGQILNFNITNSGYGYVAAPTVAVGTTSGTAAGGTFSTVATGLTARAGLYNLTLNFFSPATSAVQQGDDAVIPSNRKINTLALNGNGRGLSINSNLTLYGSAPLTLAASGSAPGNVLNLNGNNLYCSWNGYAGATSTNGATAVYIKGGSMTIVTRGGGTTGSTLNFPFQGNASAGTFGVFTGTGAATSGSDALAVTVTELGAPTNNVTGSTGLALGSRSYRVQAASTLGVPAVMGTNPTVTMNYATAVDQLTTLQNQTFIAEGASQNGAWTLRSAAISANATALIATGTLSSPTVAPGPVSGASDRYFAWATTSPSITSVSPTTVCATSGLLTITGTNLNTVTAVKIGGTPVSSFTINSATQIVALAGNGTTGVVSVTSNGAEIFGSTVINVNPAPGSVSVSPGSATISSGGTATFTATGTETIFNWYTVPAGGTPVFTGDTYTASPGCNTTTYYVAQSNGSCEGPRTAVTVTVQLPAIDIIPSTTTYCQNTPFTLSATTANPNYVFTWSGNGAATLNSTSGGTVTSTPTAAGNLTFILSATDTTTGCINRDTLIASVSIVPTVTVTPSAPAICLGDSVTLTGFAYTAPAGGTSPSYAASNATSTADEDIGNVTFGSINNTSTCSTTGGTGSILNQYSNYTALAPAIIAPGASVSYSLTSITCGGNFSNKFAIFIDWNRDGDFLDAAENPLQSVAQTGPHTVTGTITVPVTALAGATRLRVINVETTGAILSTGTYTWGETEDYTVLVGNTSNLSYAWTPITGVANPSGLVTKVAPTTSTVYTLTATGSTTGCSSGVNATVTVNPLPALPVANDGTHCGNQVPVCSVDSIPGATQYRWYAAATGGTALQSGPSRTYNTPIATTTTFYVAAFDGNCEGPRVAVTEIVTQPDAIDITSSSSSFCINSSYTLSVSTTNQNYAYIWSGNGTGTLNTNTGGTVISSPTTAGTLTFIVTATDAGQGCVITDTLVAVVNSLPNAIADPASSTICQGESVQLNVSGTINATIGTQTSVNTTTGYPAAYGSFYYGHRQQIMVLASELTAAGFTAGPINSLAFTLNGAAGQALTGFTIKMANVTAANLSTEQTVSTTVFGPTTYNSVVGVNTHTFSTPFVWNGTSNVVIETCFNNSSYTTNSTGPICATPFVSCRWFNADNATVCGSATSSTSSSRPQLILNGTALPAGVTYSWSPATGLSNPSIANPVASPSTNTTYTVAVTNPATGCSAVSTALVNVNPAPDAPTANNSSQCGTAIPTASVNAVAGATSYFWFDAPTGGNLLQADPSLTYLSAVSATTTFYVASFDGTCYSTTRTPVTVTVAVAPAILAVANDSSLCAGTNTITLTETSGNYPNYTWTSTAGGALNSTSGASVTASPSAAGTYTYTVTGTDGFCSNTDAVTVVVGAIPPAPTGISISNASICQGATSVLTAQTGAGGGGGSLTYCPSGASSTADTKIQGVTLGTLNNSTAPTVCEAYTDYTATVSAPVLVPGQSYSASITHGSCSGVYFGGYSKMWIDFNQNGVFEDPAEFVLGGAHASLNSVVSGSVSIPLTATPGTTRMRVVLNEAGSSALLPCDNFTWGETEDYNVFISGNIPGQPVYLYSWGPAGSVSPATGTSTTFTGSALGANTVVFTVTDSATGCAISVNSTINVSQTAAAPTCSGVTRCGQGSVTLTATAAGAGQLFWTENGGGNILGLGNSLTRTVTTGGVDYVREFPTNLDTTTIGYNPVSNPSTGVGYFPTTTQGMYFRVDNPQGMILKSLDIIPNAPVGSAYAFSVVDSLGNVIGTASGVTTVTNLAVASGGLNPPFNVQTVDINIFVPFSASRYYIFPTQNPNLLVHQNPTVGASAPWQIVGDVQILGYGQGLAASITTPAYTIFANTFGFFYNWQIMHGCYGPACAATYVVSAPPALNITAGGPTTFCATGGVNTVSLDATTASDPSYVNFNWQPAAGLSSTTGAVVTASVTSTTTYIVTADDGVSGGCANSDTITITVNAAPFVSTGAVPDTICTSTALQLNGSGGPASYKFVGTNQNFGATSGWPFNGANASQRMQVGISAAELNAAGLFGPTFINSLGFQVANKLSNQPYNNFTVSVQSVAPGGACFFNTTNATFGPSNVVYTGNVSTVLGWNDLVFQTPFFWNGTSDLIINTCFTNTTNSFFDVVFTTPTTCPTVRADNASACGAATGTLSLQRPNMRFQGGAVNYSWSPATELSAANIANPVFTGTGGVGPRTLVVTVTDPSNNCTASSSVSFYVNSKPKSPVISFVGADTTACNSGVVTLTATFNDGSLLWQQSSDGITFTDIAGATSTTLTRTFTSPTYVRAKAFCSDTSFSNVKFVQVFNPTILTAVGDTVCGQGNVTLTATANPGYFIQWYSDSLSSVPLVNNGTLNTFIAQTDTFWVRATVDTNSVFGGGSAPTYCATSNAASACITNVTFNTLNYSSTGCIGGPVWPASGANQNIVPESTATTQLIIGQSYNLSVTCDGSAITSVWIDYNKNGVYEASEWQQVYTAATTGIISVTIPATAIGGKTGMRVRSRLSGNVNGAGDACLSMGSGETEDFEITIGSSACSSPKIPVIALATPPPAITVSPASATICQNSSVTLNVTSGSNDYSTFTWTPSNGLNTTSGLSVVATPSVTTSYTVTASGNPNGCVTSATIPVTVNPAPAFTLSSNSNSVCGGGTVTVTANVTSPVAGTYTVAGIPHNPVTAPASPSAGPTGDDSQSAGVALPFPFVFNGAAQNTVNIYTNGFIEFGTSSGSTVSYGATIPTAFAPNNIVALAWEDLNATTGNIQYWTDGVAPNRKFVVAYNNVFYWPSAGNVTGQIVLNEGSNTIDMFLTNIDQAGSNSSVCGIENATGSYGLVAPGRQFGAWGTGIVTNEGWRFAPDPASSISWTGPGIVGATNTSTITAQPTVSSYYVATVTNPLTNCSKVDSILIQASPNPQPNILNSDTAICGGAVIDVVVADNGPFSGGYPAGTNFLWRDALGTTIVSGPDIDTIQSNNGSSYNVVVTLPSGCVGTSDTVNIVTKSVTFIENVTPATCVSLGQIIVSETSPSSLAPYRYVWSTDLGQTNIVRDVTKNDAADTLANTSAGTYYLQIFDNVGNSLSCNSGVAPIVVAGTSEINVTVNSVTDVSCFGQADGIIDISWTGGAAPYSIDLSNGTSSGTQTTTASSYLINSLASGNYTVIVADGNGCDDTVQVNITEPAQLSVALSATAASSPTATDGSATAVVSGGTAPYTIDWFDNSLSQVGSGATLSNVAGGLYYCLVTDDNGCQTASQGLEDTITVPVISNATVNLTFLFEGMYDAISGEMVPALLNSGISLDAAECDTVRIEIRDQLSPATVLESGIGVVSTTGQVSFTFPSTLIGQSGYIAVFHRNTVETWSELVTFASTTTYNFTTSASQAFGGNQVEVATGVWAFYTGDIDDGSLTFTQDGFIDIFDFLPLDGDIQSGNSGYVNTDLNGDGFVDAFDFLLLDPNVQVGIGKITP